MNKRYYEHTLSTTREFIEYLLIPVNKDCDGISRIGICLHNNCL